MHTFPQIHERNIRKNILIFCVSHVHLWYRQKRKKKIVKAGIN